MSKNIKTILLLVGLVALLIVAGVGYNALSAKQSGNNVVEQSVELADAPDFTVTNAAGEQVSLEEFKGVPIVLNFWASWCGPCRSEMPDFDKVYQEYSQDQLRFLMLNVTDGQSETFETASQYVAESGFSFPILFDAYPVGDKWMMQQAAATYHVRGIPTSYFINAEGKIVKQHVGALTENMLREYISLIME